MEARKSGFPGWSIRLRRSAGVVAIGVIPLTACFEEPVAERLRLEFRPDNSVVVSVTTTIAASDDGDGNPALARRLADTRRDHEQGNDPWSSRFALLEPLSERITWERREGRLSRVVRSAEVESREALRRFMFDAGLAFDASEQGSDLELVVGTSLAGRASRAERDRIGAFLESWSRDVAATYAATAALYEYIGGHPNRALPCLASLFSDAVSAEDRRGTDDVDEHEAALLQDIVRGRKAALKVFEVPDGEAHSLNEMSHRVFDPFPARLEVVVPGEAIEVEGFVLGNDGVLRVNGLGLFEALEALAGRWATPDPIVTYVHAMRERSERTLDPAALSVSPPVTLAPTPEDVREALLVHLRPAGAYRVVFHLSEPD